MDHPRGSPPEVIPTRKSLHVSSVTRIGQIAESRSVADPMFSKIWVVLFVGGRNLLKKVEFFKYAVHIFFRTIHLHGIYDLLKNRVLP